MSTMAVTVIALALVLSVPVAAAVLVSVASRREDREWTLAGPAPGPARAAARRIVAFHSESMDWPATAGVRRIQPASAPEAAVRALRPQHSPTGPGAGLPPGPESRLPPGGHAPPHSPAAGLSLLGRQLPAAAGALRVSAMSGL